MEEIASPPPRKASRTGSFWLGVGLLLLGILLTAVSAASAAPGGSYTIWFGLMLVGIWRIARALS
jgi:uncharacterized membrane protein